MTYIVKDLSLIDTSYWYVNKQTVKGCLSIADEFREFDKKDGDGDFVVTNICEPVLPSVYSFKLFEPEWCKRLVEEIKLIDNEVGLQPNLEEDELRQIPEFVINDSSPDLYNLMRLVLRDIISPVNWSLFGHGELSLASVQIAHYNPKGKVAGAWHHDASADFTVVVPLNTGDYVGGGTEFFNLGTVEPLDTGSALIFPSTSHMHRGLAVESGDRYLLVFWLYLKNRIPDLINNIVY